MKTKLGFKITCSCPVDKKTRRLAWKLLRDGNTYRTVQCDVCKAEFYSTCIYTKFLPLLGEYNVLPTGIDPTTKHNTLGDEG